MFTSFQSMDLVQRWLLGELLEFGESVQPRGLPTLELAPAAFVLTDPRRRCVSNRVRGWSLPLALGELCWHLGCRDDVAALEYYAPRWREFVDDTPLVRGASYGKCAFGADDGRSQWHRVLRLLKRDPQSRRAVLSVHATDLVLDPDRKDVSCACTVQFLVRSGRLHAVTHMRSNDVIWGLPYDVFQFTMWQEILAVELGLELGSYHHVAGSLHIYDRHLSLARRVLDSPECDGLQMPRLSELDSLPRFLNIEAMIRGGVPVDLSDEPISNYWRHLAEVLVWYASAHQDHAVSPNSVQKGENPYFPLLSVSRGSLGGGQALDTLDCTGRRRNSDAARLEQGRSS